MNEQRGFLVGIDKLTPEEQDARVKLEAKRRAAIAYLGEKWVLHPSRAPKNSRTPVSMLGGMAHAH